MHERDVLIKILKDKLAPTATSQSSLLRASLGSSSREMEESLRKLDGILTSARRIVADSVGMIASTSTDVTSKKLVKYYDLLRDNSELALQVQVIVVNVQRNLRALQNTVDHSRSK